MKFYSYRLKHIHYGISSFEAYNLHYQSRRYKCPTCNKYQSGQSPFGDRNRNVSKLTKYAILEDLKNNPKNY